MAVVGFEMIREFILLDKAAVYVSLQSVGPAAWHRLGYLAI
jgi:hypothetical protein